VQNAHSTDPSGPNRRDQSYFVGGAEVNRGMQQQITNINAVRIITGKPWQDTIISVLEPQSPYRPWSGTDGVEPGVAPRSRCTELPTNKKGRSSAALFVVELPGIEDAYNRVEQRKRWMGQHGPTWGNAKLDGLCADRRQHAGTFRLRTRPVARPGLAGVSTAHSHGCKPCQAVPPVDVYLSNVVSSRSACL
jgi:hypothetical protein